MMEAVGQVKVVNIIYLVLQSVTSLSIYKPYGLQIHLLNLETHKRILIFHYYIIFHCSCCHVGNGYGLCSKCTFFSFWFFLSLLFMNLVAASKFWPCSNSSCTLTFYISTNFSMFSTKFISSTRAFLFMGSIESYSPF